MKLWGSAGRTVVNGLKHVHMNINPFRWLLARCDRAKLADLRFTFERRNSFFFPPMPLNSLRESILTLEELNQRARKMRGLNDLPAGAMEQVDRMMDETIDTMKTLVDLLIRAHRNGDLDSMVRHDSDESDPNGGALA